MKLHCCAATIVSRHTQTHRVHHRGQKRCSVSMPANAGSTNVCGSRCTVLVRASVWWTGPRGALCARMGPVCLPVELNKRAARTAITDDVTDLACVPELVPAGKVGAQRTRCAPQPNLQTKRCRSGLHAPKHSYVQLGQEQGLERAASDEVSGGCGRTFWTRENATTHSRSAVLVDVDRLSTRMV